MDFQSALRMGLDLASYNGRDLFNFVVERRSYRKESVPVPEHHKQALALICKHAGQTRDRSYLMSGAWFTDWSRDTCDEGDGPSAWIAPKGMIYPIHYANHCYFAQLAGQDGCTRALELAGWVHVSGGRFDIMYEPSSLQRKAMEKVRAWGGDYREKEMRSSHPKVTNNVALNRLDRVPRANFVADANFWADEHSKEHSDAVAS